MDHNPATNESSQLFRVVAETASDALISIDPDSTILFAVDQAGKFTGCASAAAQYFHAAVTF